MKHTLTLDYSLGEGWLRPWIEGVQQGRAVASTCSTCDRAQFPPLRICPVCRAPSDGWRVLEGGATVAFRTTGVDGDFALARFDGAEGGAVVRTDGLPPHATRGRLRPTPDARPVMTLGPETPE